MLKYVFLSFSHCHWEDSLSIQTAEGIWEFTNEFMQQGEEEEKGQMHQQIPISQRRIIKLSKVLLEGSCSVG
jgi:hypothetical protein